MAGGAGELGEVIYLVGEVGEGDGGLGGLGADVVGVELPAVEGVADDGVALDQGFELVVGELAGARNEGAGVLVGGEDGGL